MAHGTHWEWRGFGTPNEEFDQKYFNLPPFFDEHQVDDLYVWVPGLPVNVKCRVGAEGGLKLKWFEGREGRFEKWREDPDDIYQFPLSRHTVARLSDILSSAGSHLNTISLYPVEKTALLAVLAESDIQMIEVRKMRSSRVWRSGNRRALVERSVLTVPERLVSVSLESWPEDNGAEYGNREPEDRQCLLSAISELRLIDLGFKEMNYLEAVEKWATGADSILS